MVEAQNQIGDNPHVAQQLPSDAFRNRTTPERLDYLKFWSQVNKLAPNGCWLWTGGKRNGGQGFFKTHDGQLFYSHKYAYFQGRGKQYRANSILVRVCDDKLCVNWRHYKLKGERKGGYKMTLDKVKLFKYNYKRLRNDLDALGMMYGVTFDDVGLASRLAKPFGITRQTAHDIIKGKIYKEVEDN